MQRHAGRVLLQRGFTAGPKRPLGAVASGATAAPTAAATQVSQSRTGAPAPPPPPPRQSAPASNTASTPQAARATTLVSPSPTAGRNIAAPQQKKKIIRRIIKRRKATTGASAPQPARTSAPPMESHTEDAPNAAAQSTPSAAAGGARRTLAMLNEIRKQPEGELAEVDEAAATTEDVSDKKNADAHEMDSTPNAVEEEAEGDHYAPAVEADEENADMRALKEAKEQEEEVEESDYTAEERSTAAAAAAAAPARKTTMVKGYRIEEVTNVCNAHDAIFARRLPSGGCQFFAWPGTPLPVASAAILSMPDTIRTVHAVFGRIGTPIDIVMDIDCQVPQEYWTMTKIRPFQMKLLDDVLSVLKAEVEKIGEKIETQVVLQSPNLKKASFHVHTKLKDAAFADVNSLHGFLTRFQDRLPNVDMQIYRSNGMLRMFSCMKENHTSAIIVFDDPKWNIGFPDGRVSDEQAALHSVCVRDPATFTRTLTFASPRAYMSAPYGGGGGGAEGEEGDSSRASIPPQVRLPLTEKEAVKTASRWLRSATETEVGEWRSWIGLGLCAYRIGYHFRNAKGLPRPALEEMLDAWTEASRQCPLKFHGGECETRWASFSPEKMRETSDWWGAYKRLGRLENPAQEAAVLDAQEKERQQKARSRWPEGKTGRLAAPSSAASSLHANKFTSTAAAAAAPEAKAEEEEVAAPPAGIASAARKLKLKKRKLRST